MNIAMIMSCGVSTANLGKGSLDTMKLKTMNETMLIAVTSKDESFEKEITFFSTRKLTENTRHKQANALENKMNDQQFQFDANREFGKWLKLIMVHKLDHHRQIIIVGGQMDHSIQALSVPIANQVVDQIERNILVGTTLSNHLGFVLGIHNLTIYLNESTMELVHEVPKLIVLSIAHHDDPIEHHPVDHDQCKANDNQIGDSVLFSNDFEGNILDPGRSVPFQHQIQSDHDQIGQGHASFSIQFDATWPVGGAVHTAFRVTTNDLEGFVVDLHGEGIHVSNSKIVLGDSATSFRYQKSSRNETVNGIGDESGLVPPKWRSSLCPYESSQKQQNFTPIDIVIFAFHKIIKAMTKALKKFKLENVS